MRRNERADLAAKSAQDLGPDKFKMPYTDLKPKINIFIHTKWQKCWNNNIHCKLFLIKPTLGYWRPAFRKSEKERVTISRLRIGLTRFAKHAELLDSFSSNVKFSHRSENAFSIQIVWKDLFENINIDEILSFLKKTKLYQNIRVNLINAKKSHLATQLPTTLTCRKNH